MVWCLLSVSYCGQTPVVKEETLLVRCVAYLAEGKQRLFMCQAGKLQLQHDEPRKAFALQTLTYQCKHSTIPHG
jgi:hypothetical protein